ncbi:DNA recombination protein rmuC,DNA recombination protein RmuC,RmuC family [Chlamydia serpentis]|uniref:DNA recombination protein rmuC,DNA recombination protein RmuC,RmuC family n=1 Tax=Chlamydia serpentis TaxID=1967782 RepID=A0A2R8FCU2_9CHLA|nr:DNA recombination protein RmuC [Chlamydia serpentis]SPN74087.1 DNA recombination protein rmuC,DNA recombination protein RmuC,RmuC family [Chlamydia serpentis]
MNIPYPLAYVLLPGCAFCLGVFVASYYYLKKKNDYLAKLQKLEHENQLLQASLDLSRHQEQLLEDFSNRLAVSSHNLIKDMKEEAQSYFCDKSKSFESMLSPIQTTLTTFKQSLEIFETKHAEDRGRLKEQMVQLLAIEKKLEHETHVLTDILKHPGSRGRWGEIQLERILELAGMLKYCDYDSQATSMQGSFRADIIVRLPQDRCLIIDAKTPISDSYFSLDEIDKADLINKIKEHIKSLKSKSYWEKFEHSPEYVILFLPGESLFNDAIRLAPELMEIGASSNVILSSPLTLLALLKTIAYMWKQENLQKQIQEIGLLGKELHRRLQVVFTHFYKIGKNLNQTVQSYNDMASSFQHRVLPTLRKFESLETSSSSHQIEEPTLIESIATSFPQNSDNKED